jgi:hypothetical protein
MEVVPEGPPFPDEVEYLWRWFNELSLGIASNGMSPAQVTWRDVEAWARMTSRSLATWEARALVTLGVARANIAAQEAAKPKAPDTTGKPPSKSRRR